MTDFKRGDVVLVAFPFTDLSTTKTRPALVVSSDSFHRSGLDVILVGITSQIAGKNSSTDVLLSLEDQHYAGLPKPSMVRMGKIVTLDRRLIRKRLGQIPESTLSKLTSLLHQLLSAEPSGEGSYRVQEPPAVYKTGRHTTPRVKKKPK